MHDTLAAVKTASLELDAAVKARDEEIAATFPQLSQLQTDAATYRARLSETKAEIATVNEGVAEIKAKHSQAIADAEGVLVAARNARKVHLTAAKSEKAGAK